MALNSFFPCLRVPGAKPPVTLVHKAFKSSAGAVLGIPMLLLLAGGGSRTAFAQAVTYTGSGAVSFGSVNACASGKATPAPCSKTLALTYNVTASGGLGTPKALTAGAPNQDYKVASGSTCTGSVTMGNTCKVNVTFAPTLPGARNGAVEIVDDSGNALATTYIYGTGVGPQITFSQPAQRMIVGNFGYDRPLAAVDGNGNVFVTAEGATSSAPGLVEELLAVNGSVPTNPVVKVLAQSQGIYSGPTSVAVDGAGNVFFTASQYPEGGYVEELLAADGYVTSTFLGGNTFFAEPTGIAVDGSGNVFVCSTGDEMSGNYFFGGLYEIPAAGGYATVNTLGGGLYPIPTG